MRIRTFIAVGLLFGLLGFLSLRIFTLEQRVSALTTRLGHPHDAGVVDAGEPAVDDPASNQDVEQRVSALEKRLDTLSTSVRGLERFSRLGTAGPQADKEILSVVERENSRLRDVQLEWQRSRWNETRDAQFMTFARQYNLSSDQTTKLRKSLEQEADSMFELLRRPTLLEDPDQAAADWQAVLDATDRDAQSVLTAQQVGPWVAARTFERRILWPWLPAINLNK
jgi:hypothetical protein